MGRWLYDLNCDRVIDGADLTPVIVAWSSLPGDPNYNALADVDCDGVIGTSDLSKVRAHIPGTSACDYQ